MSDPKHPTQPIVLVDGVVRFKGNEIVMRLHREGTIDLNEIDLRGVPIEDVEQFWQLLGLTVSGYGELSFIRPETVERADEAAEEIMKGVKTR